MHRITIFSFTHTTLSHVRKRHSLVRASLCSRYCIMGSLASTRIMRMACMHTIHQCCLLYVWWHACSVTLACTHRAWCSVTLACTYQHVHFSRRSSTSTVRQTAKSPVPHTIRDVMILINSELNHLINHLSEGSVDYISWATMKYRTRDRSLIS